jgi:hypothetical protein
MENASQRTTDVTDIVKKTSEEGNKKFAFFSTIPRGGGVALTIQILLRASMVVWLLTETCADF